MFYVISYDIAEPKRLRKVAKTMEDFGARVQFSVFECDLDAANLDRLIRRLRGVMKAQDDSVRFYALCQADVPRIRVLGHGTVSRVLPFEMV